MNTLQADSLSEDQDDRARCILADLRKTDGMTQHEFSRVLGYCNSACHKMENREGPQRGFLERAAAYFCLTIDDLATEEVESFTVLSGTGTAMAFAACSKEHALRRAAAHFKGDFVPGIARVVEFSSQQS